MYEWEFGLKNFLVSLFDIIAQYIQNHSVVVMIAVATVFIGLWVNLGIQSSKDWPK